MVLLFECERICAPRSLYRHNVAGEAGSRTLDGPPAQRGTETPLACTPRTLLVMGYDGAFDGRRLMGTDEAKAAIDVEKGAPSQQFQTWRLGWRVAESFFCPSSNGSPSLKSL